MTTAVITASLIDTKRVSSVPVKLVKALFRAEVAKPDGFDTHSCDKDTHNVFHSGLFFLLVTNNLSCQ